MAATGLNAGRRLAVFTLLEVLYDCLSDIMLLVLGRP